MRQHQFLEETVVVVSTPTERVQRRTLDVSRSQVLEETVKVVRLVPCERVRRRTAEQLVDVPHCPAAHIMPVMEEIVNGTAETVRLLPHQRVQQRTAEHIVDVPQFSKETVELVRLVLQERVQWADKQMVNVFSGKEELCWDEHSKKIDAVRVQK